MIMTSSISRLALTAITALMVVTPSLASAQSQKEYGYTRPLGAVGQSPSSIAYATRNDTPYSQALYCLASRGGQSPAVAVGRISDMTGKYDLDSGARVTQGASLMAISALGKAGISVVERLDSTISEIELAYAKDHLLSDSPELAGKDPNNYRRVYRGQIAGSRYYIVGGVTELNNNIRSSGFQGVAGYKDKDKLNATGQITARDHVMNVAVDLRLVDTRSQQVVQTVSYQKQIMGKEFDASLGGSSERYGLGINGGAGRLEPLQSAVRAMIELGVYELVAPLKGSGGSCQ